MSEKSHYERLASINVNEKTEKKGSLSYLSWAWAVDQLLRNDPLATWEYREPVRWNETVMVFCSVTAFGKTMTAQLPVMDNRNKAISNPDSFQVNTSMQRCLAKAIALHGLGLYIYAGEDLPEADMSGLSQEEIAQIDAMSKDITILINDGEQIDEVVAMINKECLGKDPAFKSAIWSKLDSKSRGLLDNCENILLAESLGSLIKVWNVCPIYAKESLEELKNKRKEELTIKINS